MLPIRLHPTVPTASANPPQPFIAPEVIAVQAERRRLIATRLHALDDLDAARRWTRWADSRTAALACLGAGRRLERLDAAIARLDDQLAREVTG